MLLYQHTVLICTKMLLQTTRTAKLMEKSYIPYFNNLIKLGVVITTVFAVLASPIPLAYGQEVKLTVRGSGLPVPRFVSLKFDETNLRAGPGKEYPVLWQYRQEGLPLLVDAEFGVWRKVIDPDGTTGWMHGAGLSLRRMAFIQKGMAKIFNRDNTQSGIIAMAEKNALLELKSCPRDWCQVTSGGVRGWVERSAVWGILKGESLK
jgi:SH3-like domain-containing protein